jgi:hypothetical protein
MQTMIIDIQYMFCHQVIAAQKEHISFLKSEDAACADRLRFQADIKAMIFYSPSEPGPNHSTYSVSLEIGITPISMVTRHNTSPHLVPVGRYYPSPPGDTMTVVSRTRSCLFPKMNMASVLPILCCESPLLAPPNKFSHCFKLKMTLVSTIKLTDGMLLTMETFGLFGCYDVCILFICCFCGMAGWKFVDHFTLSSRTCTPS